MLCLAVLALCSVSQAAELLNADVREVGGRTEVALRFSGNAQYRYFGLDNPPRLVVDVSDTSAKLAPVKAAGYVKGLRTGVRNGNDLRLVLDLNQAVKASVTKTIQAGQLYLAISLRDKNAAASASKPPPTQPAAVAPKPVAKPQAKPEPAPVLMHDVKQRRPVRVVIDAGHGGKDSGAIGPNGTQEKDVALAISQRLYRILNDSPDFAPVMSRAGDRFLKLRRRIDVARDNKSDAFVSIHANSFTDRSVRGGSVYALSIGGATSEHARWLAERENSADLVGGVSIHDKDNSLASVLLDLSQTATLEASLELASNVLSELGAIGPLHKNTVQQAGFLVLKSPDIPSILVETAYISNPKEERKLRDARYQQKVANAIFRGLRDFFVANPPPGTLFAQHGGDYIVRRGDTLSHLAQRWGTTVAAIRKTNNLRGNTLEVGQRIIIP